jgi:phosphate-selective porin OprO and OprP
MTGEYQAQAKDESMITIIRTALLTLLAVMVHATAADSQEIWPEAYPMPARMRLLPPVQEVLLTSDVTQLSQEPTVEQRLADMEAKLKSLESKAGDKTLVKSGHSGSTMRISGRVHADYWGFPGDSPGANLFETGDPDISPQDRVGFRRLRLGMSGDLPANMNYKVEVEYAAGNDVALKDSYLGWNELPVFQTMLVGIQKRPYGLDHLNSSRYNVFMERPFIVEAHNQDARRLGICAYGVSEDEQYNWRYGVFNLRDIQNDGFSISDHLQPEFASRFAHTFWYDETSGGRGYAHWAISGTTAHPDGSTGGDPDPIGSGRSQNLARFRTRPEARTSSRWLDTGRIAGADWYQLLGLEGVVNLGPTQVVAEYQTNWVDRDAGFGDTLNFHGGYIYVSYFLTGEHVPWERDSGTIGRVRPFEDFFLVRTCDGGLGRGLGAWQVAVRWSYADFNDENIFGGVGEAITFGLNWHWTANARLQFNYVYADIKDRDTDSGAPLVLTDGHSSVIGTRFMVDF